MIYGILYQLCMLFLLEHMQAGEYFLQKKSIKPHKDTRSVYAQLYPEFIPEKRGIKDGKLQLW